MKFGKLLILIVVLSMAAGLCACKSRTAKQPEEENDVSEAAVVLESPKAEEDDLRLPPPVSEPASEDSRAAYELAESFLKSARTGERLLIQDFVDYSTLFRLQEGQNPDWILGQILMRMKYEILSGETEENSSLISVKFSNVDMGVVMPLYFRDAMTFEFENALSDDPKSPEQLEKEYQRIFAGLISKNGDNRVEKTVDIELTKEDEKWKIKPTDALGNAMLGGYLDAQGKFAEAVPEIAEKEVVSSSYEDEDQEYRNGEISMVAPRE